MKVTRKELNKYLEERLELNDCRDYGPNGLQIEGPETIEKIAFAVSATADSIEKAVDYGVDTMIVHHGLFWSFHGPKTLTGPFAKRVFPLVRNNINLFGLHIPLDGNIEIGHAASIAKILGASDLKPFGDYKGCSTGVKAVFDRPIKSSELFKLIKKEINPNTKVSSPDDSEEICSIGIITGGASSGWMDAAASGLDAYLTGEMSEHDWHESKEAGIHMFAAGHNATEEFGVKELMKEIQEKFRVECFFIGSDNPA